MEEAIEKDNEIGFAIISVEGKLLTDDLARGGLTSRSKAFFGVLSKYVENDVDMMLINHSDGLKSVYFANGKHGGDIAVDSILAFTDDGKSIISTSLALSLPKSDINSLY